VPQEKVAGLLFSAGRGGTATRSAAHDAVALRVLEQRRRICAARDERVARVKEVEALETRIDNLFKKWNR
jgi:hypothetical protein